jgi:hypothetical protein
MEEVGPARQRREAGACAACGPAQEEGRASAREREARGKRTGRHGHWTCERKRGGGWLGQRTKTKENEKRINVFLFLFMNKFVNSFSRDFELIF